MNLKPHEWYPSPDLSQDGVEVRALNSAGMPYTVAMVRYGGTADPSLARERARLIAAAPGLALALRGLMAALSEDGCPGLEDAKYYADKALAKADGAV